MDLPVYFPWMATAVGEVYLLLGRVTDAVPLLTQALEQTQITDMAGFRTLCSLPLGEAQLLGGCVEAAHDLATQTLALARSPQERGHQAHALRLLGAIAARREAASAEAYYRQAITLAESLVMRPLRVHCHFDLGRLYVATGKRELAHSALSTALALYRAMEISFWLLQAEAALARVED